MAVAPLADSGDSAVVIEYRLPPKTEMLSAFLKGDGAYDGIFLTAVKTTRIFCRPSCTARKPKPENVEFFANARDAANAGYRPCKRCRPLEPVGSPPEWLRGLLAELEADPGRKWRDADIRDLGLAPERVRRWFIANHQMTFHAYCRVRRLGEALSQIRGGRAVTDAALDAGYESLSGFGDAFRAFFGSPPKTAKRQTTVVIKRLMTPLGPLVAGSSDAGICLCEFVDRRMLETQLERLRKRIGAMMVPGDSKHLATLKSEMEAYFAGELTTFSVAIDTPGTEFQKLVWSALQTIPYGETRSYGQLAAELGRPTASRAVARANGDNRLAILIPCHRVIGADGSLTGYGGGLWRKQKLLEHERGAEVDAAN